MKSPRAYLSLRSKLSAWSDGLRKMIVPWCWIIDFVVWNRTFRRIGTGKMRVPLNAQQLNSRVHKVLTGSYRIDAALRLKEDIAQSGQILTQSGHSSEWPLADHADSHWLVDTNHFVEKMWVLFQSHHFWPGARHRLDNYELKFGTCNIDKFLDWFPKFDRFPSVLCSVKWSVNF